MNTTNYTTKITVEQLVFDFIFINMFAIEAISRVFPGLFSIIPSRVFVIIFVLMAAVLIILNPGKLLYITYGEGIFLLVVLFYLICSFLGNSFMQKNTFSPSFLVLVVFSLFLFTRNDIEMTLAHLEIDSFIICVIYCILAVTSSPQVIDSTNQYMMIGYGLSFQTIILFESIRQKRIKWLLLIPIFFSVMILLFGNRGAFIVVLFYWFVVSFLSKEKSQRDKKFLFKIVAIILLIVVVLGYGISIIKEINGILVGLGISSRSFDKLLSSSFTSDMDRRIIRDIALQIIGNNPFAIRGPGYMTTVYIDAILSGANAHNIILELLIEYGVVIGTAISIIIISRLFVAIRYVKRIGKKRCMTLTLCALTQALAMLMFSSTLYTCNELWIGLVVLSLCKHIYRKENLTC